MTPFRALLRAGAPVLLLAAGCGGGAEPEPAATTAAAEPSPTPRQFEHRSPSAAVVDAFNAICAEPARRRSVAGEAARRGFVPVQGTELRAELRGAAIPPEAEGWRGPGEVGGAVLVWDAATATCEMRAIGLDAIVVESEFAKLPQALEAGGASVMQLQPPPLPARAGAPRTRQMLLVSLGGLAGPERARVLRLGDGGSRDTVVLSARGVAGAGPAASR